MTVMPLAPYAMDVHRTRGRRFPEPQHPYRNDYARDRDRVIHSRAFRRLESKTQVFTTRYSDHFRNRLTHTLEVAQIARTVAGALNLNTDLAEALALVHDIGHPPFGHAGERKLDERMRASRRPLRSQSARAAHRRAIRAALSRFSWPESHFRSARRHREAFARLLRRGFSGAFRIPAHSRPPLEAQLIDLVDEIAYNTADLDDAYEAHLIDLDLLRAEVPLFAES